MNPIILAVLLVSAVGLLCAVILVVAAHFMAVKTDERVEQARDCLPGANCGACGYTGCDGYAKALVEDPSIGTNRCIPGGDAASRQLSELLGVEFQDVVEKVATIHCMGDCDTAKRKADYKGVSSCAAAAQCFGGEGVCAYGCLGCGDCAKACPNGAICIENGIAHVDTRKCTGCGLCTKACPRKLITVMPDVEMVLVTCNNPQKGALVRSFCSHGCIGCKKCEKSCPNGAVTVPSGIAVIDYDKCQDCDTCAKVCPTGCIMVADFSGIHRYVVKE